MTDTEFKNGFKELRANYKDALKELKKYNASWLKDQHNGIYFRNGEWYSNDFNTYASDIVISSQYTETKKLAVDYLKDILKNF